MSLIVAREGVATSSPPLKQHFTEKDEEVIQELPEPTEGAEIAVALQLESDQGSSVTTQLELTAQGGRWQRSTAPLSFMTTTPPVELPGQPPNEGIPEGRTATKEEVRATLASNGIIISDEKLFPSEKASSARSAPSAALLTADKRICFRQLFTQVGEGLGEDLFSYDGYYASKNLGIYVPGYFLGYLDASGCTPFLDIPAGYQTVQLFTIAAYDSRIIEVQTTAPPSNAEWKNLLVNFTTGTSYVSWNPTVLDEHFNITLVATEAIRRWPGWHTGTYRFYANAADNKNDTQSPHYIYVKDGDNKTMINHEFGHNFYYYNTVGSWQSWSYGLNVSSGSNCYSSYPHDIWTLEYATASMNEAAATYFAALSINYASGGDCT
ncbi:MAG: hypothetical protein KC766_39985, partial [Myxococcales bacterium]|nr:hypothetical protein [Myxococcales bacterium]